MFDNLILNTLHRRIHLIIVFALLSLPFAAHSQAAGESGKAVTIGIKAIAQGVGIANQNNYGQNEMDYGAMPGFGGGITGSFQMAPKGALLMEVLYQTWGQDYDDRFKGRHFEKEVRYAMLSVPLAYQFRFTEIPMGYSGVGSELKPQWYLLAGLQLDRILSPEIDWFLDGSETDFLSFVLEGGNGNQALIEAMGAPGADEELFTGWDVLCIAGAGFELYTSGAISFTVELRGGIGLTDMNAESWRLENKEGVYAASRNAFIGLHAGVRWLINGN